MTKRENLLYNLEKIYGIGKPAEMQGRKVRSLKCGIEVLRKVVRLQSEDDCSLFYVFPGTGENPWKEEAIGSQK